MHASIGDWAFRSPRQGGRRALKAVPRSGTERERASPEDTRRPGAADRRGRAGAHTRVARTTQAHAGARGDDRAVILAFDMRATQLRVGKVIGLTQTGDPDRPSRGYTPEVAFVQAGSIVVEPYKGRLPGTNSNFKETP